MGRPFFFGYHDDAIFTRVATLQRLGMVNDTAPRGRNKLQAPKPHKLGAEKLTPAEQRRRFIEAAREAGASEDEAAFDAALTKIAKPKRLA